MRESLIETLKHLEAENDFRQIIIALCDIAEGHEAYAKNCAEAEADSHRYLYTVNATHWGCISDELNSVALHVARLLK